MKLTIVDGSENEGRSTRLELHQNYPNPVNLSTIIAFNIPSAEFVSPRVFDMHAREVAALVDKNETPGQKSVQVDGAHESGCVHLDRLPAGDHVAAKMMVMLK